jgi:hypothetical protein
MKLPPIIHFFSLMKYALGISILTLRHFKKNSHKMKEAGAGRPLEGQLSLQINE